MDQDQHRFESVTGWLISVPSRRHLLRGLTGVGLGLGVAQRPRAATAKKPRKHKHHGSGGSAFATRRVQSEFSSPLGVTAGTNVVALADCGGAGQVVSCGYQMSATAAQLVNAVVIAVAPDAERAQCIANLVRAEGANSTAGAQISAIALCLA